MWLGTLKPKEGLRRIRKERECTGNEEDSLDLKLSFAILSINICTGILNQIRFYTTTPKMVGYIPGAYYVPKHLPAKNVLSEITFIGPQGISITLALGKVVQQNLVFKCLNAAFIWCLRGTLKSCTCLKEFEKVDIHHLADCISI